MEFKRMRIALLEPVGGHGGMDYYDYGLAQGLASSGIIVDYHTCRKTVIRDFENVNTYHTFRDLWNYPKLKKLFLFLKYYNNAISISKANRCQIGHLHFFSFSILNLLVLFMFKWKRLKTIVTVHDVDSFHGKTNNLIEKISYRLIKGIIVHNESSHNELIQKKFKLPPVTIIPHGNYLPFVNQIPVPEKGETINLLFFGQIKEVKGLDILLRALSKVIKYNKNFKLTIAGRPWKTELGKYEQLISDLELDDYVETHFRYISDEEIEQFYAKTHLVLLPYRRIYQSGVLLLTMSYGRTIIASDLPAFNEIIEDNKNGFLFKSESVDDLADKILNVSYDQIKRATTEAQNTIRGKFNWLTIGKQTVDFYKQILNA